MVLSHGHYEDELIQVSLKKGKLIEDDAPDRSEIADTAYEIKAALRMLTAFADHCVEEFAT
jgi:hypothetical protein